MVAAIAGAVPSAPIPIAGRVDCPDCGARMQSATICGVPVLRCPWTSLSRVVYATMTPRGLVAPCRWPKPPIPPQMAYTFAGARGIGPVAMLRGMAESSPSEEPERAQIELARETCEECPPEETPAYGDLCRAQYVSEPH